MTSDEFYRKFRGVNGPACRGAKMPPFNPSKVNESKFSDDMRFKEYNFDFKEGNEDEGDIVVVNWTSQCWDRTGFLELAAEIERCMKHIGFVGHVWLEAHMRGESSRSKKWSARCHTIIKKENP